MANKKKVKIDMDELYVDQSPRRAHIYDRYISSVYLPHGIKRIDSEFCHRIMNLDDPLIKLMSGDHWAGKDAVEIDFTDVSCNKRYRSVLHATRKHSGEHKYSFTHPKFLPSGLEDPEVLRKEIMDNQHLHDMIKENLISNINTKIQQKT